MPDIRRLLGEASSSGRDVFLGMVTTAMLSHPDPLALHRACADTAGMDIHLGWDGTVRVSIGLLVVLETTAADLLSAAKGSQGSGDHPGGEEGGGGAS